MIRLNAQVDSELAKIAGRHAPFAASLALNRSATGARDIVRENLPKRFRLRNNWTRGGIQARTSTKANLTARVLAPEYMLIQETGGERKPRAGRTLYAPVEDAGSSRVIPKDRRPRALLADKAFIIGMPGGDAGVFLRYGKKRGQIRLLWWMTDKQDYEDRFEFERDVSDYVQDRFSSHFIAALTDALGRGEYATTAGRGRQRIARPEGMSLRAYRRSQAKGD